MRTISGQKIQNPQTNVPKTQQMNDKDFITDLLSTEKYMTSSYGTAMNEASHMQLYQEINSICNDTDQCARDLFNTMFQKGWYALEGAPQQTIQQTFQEYSGMTSQLPSGSMPH
ncbi:spore coat protein [Salicibibacter cibi]|uniref:Spore coat protein n=2 Tax=Salicibibacter cibi TaxID=2743001 RepID=A0A7T6ZD68_9BACI|nr:spore coat protein [Salicibibacter cibi]